MIRRKIKPMLRERKSLKQSEMVTDDDKELFYVNVTILNASVAVRRKALAKVEHNQANRLIKVRHNAGSFVCLEVRGGLWGVV
mmetsp:Transcript_39704/g.40315  ORF Transcript_39704/g.40315 Transcript_39704/m.40315 type:complete len:83 (-) Transcript_39704:888-1136(-)